MTFKQAGTCMAMAVVFFCSAEVKAQKAFGYKMTKKLSTDALSGTWKVKKSGRISFFVDHVFVLDSTRANCFLKSDWTFLSDSTGKISLPKSDFCALPQTKTFKYKLIESPGMVGPMYSMDVVFVESGTSYKMWLSDYNGSDELSIVYQQTARCETCTPQVEEVRVDFLVKRQK